MSDVIHVGSMGSILFSLLGIHCLAISIKCSITFSVYLLHIFYINMDCHRCKSNDQEPMQSNSKASNLNWISNTIIVKIKAKKLFLFQQTATDQASLNKANKRRRTNKIDEKAMIRNRYNRIPDTSPDTTNSQDCIKENSISGKPRRHLFPSRCPPGYPKQNNN